MTGFMRWAIDLRNYGATGVLRVPPWRSVDIAGYNWTGWSPMPAYCEVALPVPLDRTFTSRCAGGSGRSAVRG